MYEQLNVEKVLNVVERMKGLVAELETELSSSTVEETAATVAETEIVEHEGLKLRKVNRVGREGDYVKIIESWSMDLKTGGFYKIERVDGKLGIKDDVGFFWTDFHEDFKFVETYEVIDVQAEKLPFPKVELTANQKRAKLIENAKKFVEEHAVTSHIVEFIVNRKKRTVVVLIKEYETGKVVARGIAKCAPGDVFNQWIGKAIALAKAIEIGVPNEFLKAVQPGKIVVGQIVRVNVLPHKIYRIVSARSNINNAFNLKMLEGNRDGWEYARNLIILDDTDAQYEVV